MLVSKVLPLRGRKTTEYCFNLVSMHVTVCTFNADGCVTVPNVCLWHIYSCIVSLCVCHKLILSPYLLNLD